MSKKRTVTCSKCGYEGHNRTSCGNVKQEPIQFLSRNDPPSPRGVPSLTFSHSHDEKTARSERVVRSFSEAESVVERLRITTPAYPEGEHSGRFQPSSGYGSIQSSKNFSRSGKDTKLVSFLQRSLAKVSHPHRTPQSDPLPVKTFTSPDEYWKVKKDRQPSAGYVNILPAAKGGDLL